MKRINIKIILLFFLLLSTSNLGNTKETSNSVRNQLTRQNQNTVLPINIERPGLAVFEYLIQPGNNNLFDNLADDPIDEDTLSKEELINMVSDDILMSFMYDLSSDEFLG